MRPFRSRRASAFVYAFSIATLGAAVSPSAHADPFSYLSTSPYLLGGWGGERAKLADKGINFDFSYTNEAAHNFTAGNAHTTRAAQQLAALAVLDLDKLWGIRHTTFNFEMTDRFGGSLDNDAGLKTNQQTQEIYGRGQTVWLTKMTLDRTFFNGRLLLSVGRDSEGASFDVSDCHFQNLALCGTQASNMYGNYAMSSPGSVWMGRAKVFTTQDTYVQFGVYQQASGYYDATWERHNAWAPTSPGGAKGVVLPLELGWTPKFDGREGSYSIGFMYNTAGQPNLVLDANGNPRAVSGLPAGQTGESYNGYIDVSQRLTGQTNGEGLLVNIRAAMGDRATAAQDRGASLSFEYSNPFHRKGDRIGVGAAATHSSSRAAEYQAQYNALHPDDTSVIGHSYEYTYEVFYNWQMIPSISLQPGLQYIVHPGGAVQNPNIFVAELKSVIEF